MKKIKRLTIIISDSALSVLKNKSEKQGKTVSNIFRELIYSGINFQFYNRNSKFENSRKFTLRLDTDVHKILLLKAKEHQVGVSEIIRLIIEKQISNKSFILPDRKEDLKQGKYSISLDTFWKKDDLPAIVDCIGNIKNELTVKQSLIYVHALVLKGNTGIANSVVSGLSPTNIEEDIWIKLAKVRLLIHSRHFKHADSILNEIFYLLEHYKVANRLIYARFYQCQGEILYWRENYQSSLEIMLKASNYVDFQNHPNILGHIYVQIFMSANKILRLEIAEMAYKRAKEIAKETGNIHLDSWAESEYVNSLLSRNSNELELNSVVDNNLIIQKTMDNQRGQHYSYSMLGRLHLQKRNDDDAYSYLIKSREVETSYRPKGLSFAQANIWHVEAKHNYENSISLIKEMKILNKNSNYEKMKYIYYSTKYIYGTNNNEIESGYSNLRKLKFDSRNTVIGVAAKFTIENRALYRNL